MMNTEVCGVSASEKIAVLSNIMRDNEEVKANMPVFIIASFGDDMLNAVGNENKKKHIRQAWKLSNDNLLSFLRAYAASTTFHSESTVKFRTAFSRNLNLFNVAVLDNTESFSGRRFEDTSFLPLKEQGANPFEPSHDVFGGQTGREAMGNPSVFKSAFETASTNVTSRLMRTHAGDDSWDKNWGSVIPKNSNNEYVVSEVANWLWQRLIADDNANFDVIARSQIYAMLARGEDFGLAVTNVNSSISSNPNDLYSSEQLNENVDIAAVMSVLSNEKMLLDDADVTGVRRQWNKNVNAAVNFIATLPYTFVVEGK